MEGKDSFAFDASVVWVVEPFGHLTGSDLNGLRQQLISFETWGSVSITFKELLPVVLAVAVWGPCWRGSSVLVYCVNQEAVSVVIARCPG